MINDMSAWVSLHWLQQHEEEFNEAEQLKVHDCREPLCFLVQVCVCVCCVFFFPFLLFCFSNAKNRLYTWDNKAAFQAGSDPWGCVHFSLLSTHKPRCCAKRSRDQRSTPATSVDGLVCLVKPQSIFKVAMAMCRYFTAWRVEAMLISSTCDGPVAAVAAVVESLWGTLRR